MADEHVNPSGLCFCGCGQITPIAKKTQRSQHAIKGQHQRYAFGHSPRNAQMQGYRSAWRDAPYHALHRVRAEKALGHRLPKGAEVHHPDEDPWNWNARLVICQDRAYHFLLHVRARIVRAGGNPNTDYVCFRCRRVKPRTAFPKLRGRQIPVNGLCYECANAARRTPEGRRKHQEQRARRRARGLPPN